MGEWRTCDIRAVSKADRLQTRFRLVPSHLIKLIFMESVKRGLRYLKQMMCKQREVHEEKRESFMSDKD